MTNGYWANHEYKRRSVGADVTGFVGYEPLVDLAAKFQGGLAFRNSAIFSAVFLTGGRMGEVLELKTENFQFDESEVSVKQMPLFKRYEKTGEYLEWVDEKPDNKLARLFKLDEAKGQWHRTRYDTQRKEEYRSDFSFPADEPLVPVLKKWIESIPKGHLFTGYSEKHLSYVRSYEILTSLPLKYPNEKETSHLYPHWLRAQRASCLISFYGMKMEEMMEWMGWEELTTARNYAKFGKKSLTAKMMNKPYPEAALQKQKTML